MGVAVGRLCWGWGLQPGARPMMSAGLMGLTSPNKGSLIHDRSGVVSGRGTQLKDEVEMVDAITTPEPAAKKTAVCTKMYILPDGGESRSATADATELQFRFANGKVEVVKMGDNPDAIEARLAWFGRSEKYGNFFAGAKGDSDKAHEMFLSGSENLAEGTWAERGGGEGPRPSMVVEAVVAALVAQGQNVTDERRAGIKDKLSTPDAKKQALANPAIAVQYEMIRAAAAKAKLDAAKAKAKGTEADLDAF